ncbi:MAG: agmatine deiminase family protein [Gammaproteobacteria bacterium]|jgi:agmatine/peptidylarginine deiminase|nr:agmatine deiminase family protein [Gammaproteobacteria bacterium]
MPTRRLPAEWEPQSAVMLTWPHAATDWAEVLPAAEAVYDRLAVEIAARERLLVACHDDAVRARVAARLAALGVDAGRIVLAVAPSNDTWARDHGPLAIETPAGAEILDFGFNGWGGKFEAALDDDVPSALARAGVFGATPCRKVALVVEGGALETDGAGTLLATRHSVLTGTRNPGLAQRDVEAALRAELGIERFLWLEHGALSGDDTDGHVDTLVRFADPRTLLHVTSTPDDPDHPGLEAMRAELAALRTATDEPYRLVPLPPPGRHFAAGRRLPATYANFLIVNGAVLLPVYGVANDAAAVRTVAACFPDRAVVPIDCRTLIRQSGSLHCVTMQLPASVDLCTPC